MRTKSLRELQQKGKRAVTGDSPLLLTSRKGVVGILLPVTEENVLHVQADVQRLAAMHSLRKTWRRAHKLGLSSLSADDIDHEVRKARKAARRGRRAR